MRKKAIPHGRRAGSALSKSRKEKPVGFGRKGQKSYCASHHREEESGGLKAAAPEEASCSDPPQGLRAPVVARWASAWGISTRMS